ncbi:MAG: RnfABCDGE type electron transport complex subunit D [Clostridia bacterium]|nr:RnfABCDGE type electron transport complex subunit D [Clostridia bacterium]
MKDTKTLLVASAPYIKQGDTVRTIMLDVVIALIPALAWAVYMFGVRVLTVTAVSVISSVLFEYLFQKIVKRPVTVLDFSAVVTGMLLAFTLPVSVALWVPVIGAFIAVVIAKQLLSMIGKNIINPVLTARVALYLVFPNKINGYVQPLGDKLDAFSVNAGDIIAGATPLASLKEGIAPDIGIFDLFIGNKSGCIGEISVMLLIIGGLYLLLRRVITWHIPIAFLGTVAVLTFLFPQAQSVQAYEFMLIELCSGALVLGAVFMATDYMSSPVTSTGRIIYGIGCGVITVCIRYFAPLTEGVAAAILIMNLLSRQLDIRTRSKPFGYVSKSKN